MLTTWCRLSHQKHEGTRSCYIRGTGRRRLPDVPVRQVGHQPGLHGHDVRIGASVSVHGQIKYASGKALIAFNRPFSWYWMNSNVLGPVHGARCSQCITWLTARIPTSTWWKRLLHANKFPRVITWSGIPNHVIHDKASYQYTTVSHTDHPGTHLVTQTFWCA